MPRVLILLTDGFEEIEFVTPFDILKRGGIEVVTASITGRREVDSPRGLRIQADALLDEVQADVWDLVLVPGGPGTDAMRQNALVRELLQNQMKQQKKVAAICAAPLVLADAGLLSQSEVTCFPGVSEELKPMVKKLRSDAVVRQDLLVTSKAAGTAAEFGFHLLALLQGAEVARKVQQAMCFAPEVLEN